MDRAERVAGDLPKDITAMPLQVDVMDDKVLIAAIRKVEKEFGPLDGMATVIGMAAFASILEMDEATWDLDHQRNLRYFFIAAREVARGMIARGAPGSIVCTASVDGSRSAPLHASYGCAKAGLSNLVKTMAVEWGDKGIRANVVAPGTIITPRVPHAGDRETNLTDRVPMKRRGTTQNIADAITFLLSDMAEYITGQTLAVDGGFLAQYPVELTLMPKKPGASIE
jgi:NAD(P)-dependent dehydrogenase (short-subunit alcohol dehydrogenase family)